MNSTRFSMNRRDLMKNAALLASGIALTSSTERAQASLTRRYPFSLLFSTPCLFTKPLHNRKYTELPALLNDLGIDAVDLTCRPEGHILPERVKDDLPKAVELLKSAGIRVSMVTTAIRDAKEPHAENIIETIGKLEIGYIKLGYYEYKDLRKLLQTVAAAQAKIKDIAAMCQADAVHSGYHVHSGKRIGGGLWDAWQLVENTPPESLGIYFDLRHATVEGGEAGWEIAMNLMAPRITMLALKDFAWKKDDKGQWKPDDVPLGTGMVRLYYGLEQLKQLGFAGPISLHVEYASGNRPVGSDQDKKCLEDIRRDWQTMNRALTRAKLV